MAERSFARVQVRAADGTGPVHASIKVNGNLTSVTACMQRGRWVVDADGTWADVNCPECRQVRNRGQHPMTRLPFVEG